MINWMLFQSLITSVILIVLMTGKSLALRFIGASGYYFLWALVPLSLLMGLIPDMPQSISSLSYYLVSIKQTSLEFGSGFTNLSEGILALWFLGFLFHLGKLMIAHRHYSRSINFDSIDEQSLSFTEVLEQIKSVKKVSLKVSNKTTGPFIGGLLKPYIVLPTQFAKRFSPEQQYLVIQHELNHLFRGDLIWNLLAQIFVMVFWFNPLNFVAYRQFRQCQELACDQSILQNSEKPTRVAYGKAMLLCVEQDTGMALTHLNYGAKNTMQERIENLKQHKPQPLWRWLTVAGLMFTVVLSANLVSAERADMAISRPEAPIYRVEPIYPVGAVNIGLEGSVILSFDINKNGAVKNVAIVSAEPAGIFDQAAKDAVTQWQYKPLDAKLSGLLVQLDFVLDKGQQNENKLQTEIGLEKVVVVSD